MNDAASDAASMDKRGSSHPLLGALAQLKLPLVGLQWVGNLAWILLALAWPRLLGPHFRQILAATLCALSLAFLFLWLQAYTLRKLRKAARPLPLPAAFLLVALWTGVWLLLLLLIGVAEDRAGLFAGSLRYKLPPLLRHAVSFHRLVAWQRWMYGAARWLFAGLLLPDAMETVASGAHPDAFARASHIYRRWFYWLAALVCGFGGSAVTEAAMGWRSGNGLGDEAVRAWMRLGGAYTVDLLLWCFMLGLVAFYLGEEFAGRTAITGP